MNEVQTTKSLLAKLLASENLTVEHGNFSTASFDVKNRVIHLPVFKYMSGSIYDLMVLHEVGHALYTPLEGLHSADSIDGPGFKSYLNVVEDARIEKKIKRKFPGGAKPMTEGYRQLVSEDFFGTRGIDLNKLNLIDRINLHYKMGASAGIAFNETEQVFIDEMDHAETFDEVFDIAKRLFQFSKENESQTDFQDLSHLSAYGDESDDSEQEEQMAGDEEANWDWPYDEENKSDKPDNNSEESDEESDESIKAGQGNDESDETENTEPELQNGLEGGRSEDDDSFDPRSITDDTWQERSKDLAQDTDVEYVYVNVPKAKPSQIIIPHKKLYSYTKEYLSSERYGDHAVEKIDRITREMLKDFKTKNVKTVDFLVKEFEMKKRADEYKRTATANTGVLDMSSIYSYKYNDQLFKKVATVTSGKNHGLVLFIDWSGSMNANMAGTIDQLLNLVMFCKKVNIPFEVYAFSDRNHEQMMPRVPGMKDYSENDKDLYLGRELSLLNLFSNTMSTAEYNYAMQMMMFLKVRYDNEMWWKMGYMRTPKWFDLGGTPLDDCIITALELVPEFQRKNRVQIVNTVFLTDGESHNNSERWVTDEMGNKKLEYFSLSSKYTFLVDPVTKKQYRNTGYNRNWQTGVYFQMLRDRLGVNVIGFYLIGRRFTNYSRYLASDLKIPVEEIQSSWRKEKSFIAKDFNGYNELYYIKDGVDLKTDNDTFKVKEDATKGQLTSAFKKFNRKKLSNRIVLKTFAEMIV